MVNVTIVTMHTYINLGTTMFDFVFGTVTFIFAFTFGFFLVGVTIEGARSIFPLSFAVETLPFTPLNFFFPPPAVLEEGVFVVFVVGEEDSMANVNTRSKHV